MAQLSMEEILADESAPEAELAKELMNPDERAELDATREAQASEQAEQDTATPAGDEESKGEAVEAKGEPDDLSDLPESIRATLEQRPENAENWRNLRGIAKDAQKAAREAAEQAQAVQAEKARLEAEIAALKAGQAAAAQVAAAQAPQPQAARLPDPETDPAGYAQALVAQETERLRLEFRNSQLEAFEAQAIRNHGKEQVEAAFAWSQSQADPGFQAQLDAAPDPWDFLVREHGRHKALSQMGDDPAAYIEKVKAEAAAAALAEAQITQGQATSQQVEAEIAKRLPKSLAKAPGVGGSQGAEAFTGPTPMGTIFPSLDKR